MGSLNYHITGNSKKYYLGNSKRVFDLADDADLGVSWIGNRNKQIQYFNDSGNDLIAASFSFTIVNDEITRILFAG